MKKKKIYLKPDIILEEYLLGDVLCVSSGTIEDVEIEDWITESDVN